MCAPVGLEPPGRFLFARQKKIAIFLAEPQRLRKTLHISCWHPGSSFDIVNQKVGEAYSEYISISQAGLWRVLCPFDSAPLCERRNAPLQPSPES